MCITIFLLQAFPVLQWVNDFEKNDASVEMTHNTNISEKEKEKDLKEETAFQHQFFNKQIVYKNNRFNIHISQNAIILHHTDVNAPPPDFIS